MYIKYTFVHIAIVLIRQVFRAVPLLAIIPFAVEALSLRLRSSFGLLHGSSNLLAILLEVPFLSLALFLETSDLVNHQDLMLLFDLYLRGLKHCEELRNHFIHPLHIIVLLEAFVAWCQ
jgi:hypothetical protein